MTLSRREFVKQSGLALSFAVAGTTKLLSPADAYAEGIAFSVLSDEEVNNINAICSILVPGAKEAGVAHFIDHQLNADPNDSLLVLKYFGFPPPYLDFYRPVVSAIAKLSQSMFDKNLSDLDEKEGRKLVESFRDANPEGWQAPPAPLAYHALRNDAVDVVYGTPEGFEKLGVPYMEHILPPEGWS
ncbi:MAG: Tat pathway signal protein [Gammaproteobacteria bacterium]|nr:Tat pathway signal protein [Gammaproteobacteria bacterium]